MVILSQEMIVELQDMLGDEFHFFLETFIHDMNTRCALITKALATNDAQAARLAAHSLRGSSSNVGAEALTLVCAHLESVARTDQLDDVEQLTQTLEHARLALLDALAHLAP